MSYLGTRSNISAVAAVGPATILIEPMDANTHNKRARRATSVANWCPNYHLMISTDVHTCKRVASADQGQPLVKVTPSKVYTCKNCGAQHGTADELRDHRKSCEAGRSVAKAASTPTSRPSLAEVSFKTFIRLECLTCNTDARNYRERTQLAVVITKSP
jgi:hypothetical protein